MIEEVKAQLILEVNENSFKKASWEVQQFARDTKQALDPKKISSLEDAWVTLIIQKRKASQELSKMRKLYDQGVVDVAQLKRAETSFNNISKETTEANAKLQNYRNTWDETLSRFRANFEKLSDVIEKWWTRSIENLNNELKRLKQELSWVEIWSKEFKNLQKEIWKTQEELKGVNTTAQKSTSIFSWLWKTLVAFFAIDKVLDFWKAVFGLTSKNQQLYNSFMTLTWSAEMTKNILAQIQSLADQSPFEKFALADQTKKMIWYWFEAQNAVNIMQVLGNTVSALGGWQEVLDWLTLALWQIQAKGKLSQEELNQFAERWVPAIAILTEKLWLTEEQLQNIWAEWIKASVAIPALLQWLQEKYLWALEKQSQTLAWRLPTITDSAKNEMASFWEDIIWTQNAVLDNLGRIVEDDVPIILGWVADAMNSVTELTSTVVSAVDDGFNSLTSNIAESWKKQLSIFDRISLWIRFLASWFWILVDVVVSAFRWAISIWKDLFNNFKVIWENIYSLFYNLWANIWRAFGNIPFYAKSWLNDFLWLIEKTVNNAIWLLNKIPWVTIWAVSIWKVNAGNFTEFKSFTAWFKELPWFVNLSNTAIQETSRILTANENRFKNLASDIDNIWKKSAKAFDLNTLDWLWKSINKARQELKELTIWSDEYIKKQKEIADLEAKFKNAVYSWNWTAPASSWGGGSSSWWSRWGWANSKIAKEKEEEVKNRIKQEERYNKYVEDLEKKKNEKAKENLKELENNYKDIWKIFTDETEKAKKNIEDLEKKIEDSWNKLKELKQKLRDLNDDKAKNLWERNVEINKRLAEIENERKTTEDLAKILEERKRLLEEQNLIKSRVSETDLKESERVAWLSYTEKFLEDFDKKRNEILKERELEKEKLIELQKTKDEEEKILSVFTEKKVRLDEIYFAKTKAIEESITDVIEAESQERIKSLEAVRVKALATAQALRSAWMNTWTTSTINNNINVSQNVSSVASANSYAKTLANEINLANKWIK